MLFKLVISTSISLAAVTGANAHDYSVGDIEILHPWSRPTPPNAQVAGGFLTLKNNGDDPDTLLSVETPLSSIAEIHRSVVEDGIASMRKIDGVDIAPGEAVDLEAERIHFMFVEPKQRLRDGESFPATLVFEKAGRVDVEFAVQRRAGAPEASEHSSHGG